MTKDAYEELRTEQHHPQEKKKISRSQPNQLLRQARKERCWSQADLAEQIGGTNETISRWENGVNTPQPEQLKKLCEVFGKTPAELGYPPRPLSIKIEETVEASGSFGELGPIKQGPPLLPRKRFRDIVVGTSILMIVLLVLGVVRFASSVLPTSCGGTFLDSESGSEWKWIDPSGKATYHLTPAGLTLSAPPHSDLNPSHNNLDAPRFLRPITGNFTIETQLVFRPDTNFQSSGILLWQNSTTFIHFERGFGGKNSGMFLQEWDHGVTPMTITPLGEYSTIAGTVELRIQKQGDYITALWRELGHPWQPGGSTILHFDTLLIGVDLLDVYNNLKNTRASYSDFRVICT
jgi:transcriptional regulator with XRE-family HTH domain